MANMRIIFASAFIVAVLATGLVIASGVFSERRSYTPALILQGNNKAPDFVLMDQNGQRYSLEAAKGKVVLIYFGYTHCPDECPTVMRKYAELAKALGSDVNKVDMLFITTDPERDTPQTIKAYLGKFSPNIIGLTGSQADLFGVWKTYNVPIDVEQHELGQDYFVGHFSLVLVADKNHILKFAFTPEMESSEYVQGIKSLL